MKNNSNKILVVDDEERMCQSLKILLSDSGFDVTTSQTGGNAVEILKKKNFDLVVTDIKMPGTDGMDILREAKKKDRDALVILLTGYASLDSAIKAVNFGAFDYLLKPVDFPQLKLSIQRGLEKRRMQLDKNRLLKKLKLKNQLLKKKLEELDALYKAGKSLSLTFDLEKLLTTIIRLATRVIGAKIGSIMLLDQKKRILTIKAALGLEPEVIKKTRLKLGRSIAGWVALKKKPLMVRDVEKDLRFKRINKEKYETKSLLSVPLLVKDNVLGVINLSNKKTRKEFNRDDLKLLFTFASQAAVAIDDAYQFEQTKKKVNQFSVLYQIASSLATLTEFDQISKIIFKGIRKIIPIKSAFWLELSENKDCLNLSYFYNSKSNKSLGEVKIPLKKGDISKIENLNRRISDQLDKNAIVSSANPDKKKSCFFSVPISFEGTFHGVFSVALEPDRDFTQEEKNLISIIASQAASICERQKAILNSTRLLTMGNLISEISHDLKRPLTNIKGSLQILKGKLSLKEDAKSLFDSAEEEVYILTEMINEILNFSKPDKYHMEKSKITPLVERALELVNRDLNNNKIKLSKNIQKDLPLVFLNRKQILEVLWNLLINAIESMPKGGKLEVDIKILYSENSFDDTKKERKYLNVTIKDTGVGIAPDNLKRIFERYFTTKRGGTGLGLAVVQRIIKAHNGFIQAESKPNRGSSFSIFLPIKR
ncbi:MAG: hypothetical protein AMJ90_00310 [candidate division Zixibacteria bacterium SM23_73_2]|nr:MAG: hypothetical protein AMJ90_00310 [candidate division Zixibacteria bacterium SM23_73_2]